MFEKIEGKRERFIGKGASVVGGESSFGKLSQRGLGVQVNLFGYFYRALKKETQKSQSRDRLKVYLGSKKFICFVDGKERREEKNISQSATENLEEKDLPCRSDDKINIKLKY